jgi:hypothetical protein
LCILAGAIPFRVGLDLADSVHFHVNSVDRAIETERPALKVVERHR